MPLHLPALLRILSTRFLEIVSTYGFDPRTGQAQPGKFVSNEPDIYSGVLTALGADLSGSGLPDASAFKG